MIPMERSLGVETKDRLRHAGLRPTKQRLALADLIWQGHDRHITPEMLCAEAKAAGLKLALGTIYNNLHQFTQAGLLREFTLEPGRRYFDTNLSAHQHFYDSETGALLDIPTPILSSLQMPKPPKGKEVARIDIVIHLKKK